MALAGTDGLHPPPFKKIRNPPTAAWRLAWRWALGPATGTAAVAGAFLTAFPFHDTSVAGNAPSETWTVGVLVDSAAERFDHPLSLIHLRSLHVSFLGPRLGDPGSLRWNDWESDAGGAAFEICSVTASDWFDEERRPAGPENPLRLAADVDVGLSWLLLWAVIAGAAYRWVRSLRRRRRRGTVAGGHGKPAGWPRRFARPYFWTAAAVGVTLLAFPSTAAAPLPGAAVSAWAGREPTDSPHVRGLQLWVELDAPRPALEGEAAGPGWRWHAGPPRRARPGGGTDATLQFAAWWLAVPPLLMNGFMLSGAVRGWFRARRR